MLLAVMASVLAVLDLGELFAGKAAWEESAADFAVEHARDGFTFASQKRDIVNCLKRGETSWLGREVWEARVYYAPNGGATRVEMSLFNNGDRRFFESVDPTAFAELVRDIQSKYGEGERIPRDERTKLQNGGYKFRRLWTKCDPVVELAWGATDERSADIQYVRVTLVPQSQWKSVKRDESKAASGQLSAAKLKSRLKKNPDGDVWIDGVPMVDQGKKGYCAAAVAERLLRYYGHPIDEHEIAQQAGSRAQGGTRVGDMIETVKTVGLKRRLGFNQIVSMTGSYEDVAKDVEQYNRTAKSMKESEISIARHTVGNLVMVGDIYDEMKPMVLKRMRTKDVGFKRFLAGVKAQIDKGVPICWGVTLGIYPEPGVSLQAKGGHMRLIIGYNPKTHEILYSDTWGAGHELKRMPEDWAYTITHDAFFLRPL